MNELITLIHETTGTRRDVFCGLRSIGQQEFYKALAINYHPEIKFVLADYLEYNGETIVKYGAELYRVLRTYRTGQELEIVVVRASAEEREIYG